MAVTLVRELRCNHEEADTRMLVHTQHAGGYGCAGVASWPRPQPRQMLLIKGKGAKGRIIGISEFADQLGRQVVDGILKQEVCKALIGLHALTDYDTVSAFSLQRPSGAHYA